MKGTEEKEAVEVKKARVKAGKEKKGTEYMEGDEKVKQWIEWLGGKEVVSERKAGIEDEREKKGGRRVDGKKKRR